jgi:hypothetical protein
MAEVLKSEKTNPGELRLRKLIEHSSAGVIFRSFFNIDAIYKIIPQIIWWF